MSVLTQLRATNNDTESMQSLLEGFLGNYRAFKSGEMGLEDEEKYNLFGIPGPFQYLAFSDFFSFFEKKEHMVEDNLNSLYMYNLLETGELTANPVLAFLEYISSPEYGANGKEIIMVSASFWKYSPEIRKRVISFNDILAKEGAGLSVFTGAIMNNKIPMDFIKTGNYLLIEFPHTESTVFRLVMLLKLERLKPQLKTGRTLEMLSAYFNELTRMV